MRKPSIDKSQRLPLVHLLPNLLTVTAICAGMTAIRFAYQGDIETAVQLILLAGLLDGLDGRLARLLNSQSLVGAELDSLADFLNFGVAPGLIIHAWALQDFTRAGWIAVLGYTICCVLRLARFNVSNDADETGDSFLGVPSPAGAGLVMLPMYVAFLKPDWAVLPPAFISGYMLFIGLLMISHFPTYSFKNVSIPRAKIRFMMLGIALTVVALLTYLWVTLILLSFVYFLGLIWSGWSALRAKP
ncbi:MAG: CDP-diacylglycerol--serine O-phosphatidyltransferase [Paracoccaceae bacterium]